MKPILPSTGTRVNEHTKPKLNEQLAERSIETIRMISKDSTSVQPYLEKLEREWDTERVLETNAASLILACTLLGIFVDKKWHFASGVISGFLLQHALQGWCPPLSLIRRLGVRTMKEILDEKTTLKLVTGQIKPSIDIEHVWEQVVK